MPLELADDDVDLLVEVLESCLEYLEHTSVPDDLLNKIEAALDLLEES